MACSSSMSQRGARLRKDSNPVFNWMLVFFLQVVLSSEVFSLPVLVPIEAEVGSISRFQPCLVDPSQDIKSVTWGRGPSPTDETLILERNHDDNDMDASQRFSVDEYYCLVIKNTTLADSGPYWCQVTPKETLSYYCSFTLDVQEKAPSEPTVTETTSVPTTSIKYGGKMGESKSKAAPTIVSSSNVSVFLSLMSGLLTIWLTNVAGV